MLDWEEAKRKSQQRGVWTLLHLCECCARVPAVETRCSCPASVLTTSPRIRDTHTHSHTHWLPRAFFRLCTWFSVFRANVFINSLRQQLLNL